MSSLSVAFSGIEEFNGRLATALQNTRTALETNELVLQAVSLQSQEIAKLQATKADLREVRALRADVADVQGKQHLLQAGSALITTAQFAEECGVYKDGKGMQEFGKELAAYGECLNLPPRKEVWHPGLNKNVNGHHPYVLKLYCKDHNIPVPTLLYGAIAPVGWVPPNDFVIPVDSE